MLSQDTRTAILRLHEEGHGIRRIARDLHLSRVAVRAVVRSGEHQVTGYERGSVLDEHLETVRHLHADCRGNLIRVHEELAKRSIDVPYSTLTGFCRRHQVGVAEKERAGRYHFTPGQEMQHDTSPHTVVLGGTPAPLQCASLVLCYSRLTFTQNYRRFTRFECRTFLTEALKYFKGSAGEMMVDNTSVILRSGSGKMAIPSATMAAFAKHFGFEIRAHEIGDANRSARVEGPFNYVEKNFYPGRTFEDLPDLNLQMRQWCNEVNAKYSRKLLASRAELYAAERGSLKPLPMHIPEIYDLHTRRVDLEGFINLHCNRYSVPTSSIGNRVDIHETIDRVRVYDKRLLVVDHEKVAAGKRRRVTLPEHTRRRKVAPPAPLPQESVLREAGSELDELVDRLRERHGGRAARAVRLLFRIYVDYPTQIVRAVAREVLDVGMYDLHRVEKMILQRIAGDIFRLPTDRTRGGESR